MTIEEAVKFFDDIPWLYEKLSILEEVGLGYLELGQSATTLSGGEAQRIKFSAELGKRDTRRTLYLLDEPTTGLHFADVDQLIKVLQRLVDRGNTIVVIEHNLDVIKTADWVIDLGPEGGDAAADHCRGDAGADRPQGRELHRRISTEGLKEYVVRGTSYVEPRTTYHVRLS